MKARQWMEIAAVASAIGFGGAAIANDVDRTPANRDTSAASVIDNALAQGNDTRASSAALPRDEPKNAAMNRAAELGTRVPGAPAASGDETTNGTRGASGESTTASERGSRASGTAPIARQGAAAAEPSTSDESAGMSGPATSDESASTSGPATSDESAVRGPVEILVITPADDAGGAGASSSDTQSSQEQ